MTIRTTIFETALGFAGLAWGEHGIIRVVLPEPPRLCRRPREAQSAVAIQGNFAFGRGLLRSARNDAEVVGRS
jgi:hypothetical protein